MLNLMFVSSLFHFSNVSTACKPGEFPAMTAMRAARSAYPAKSRRTACPVFSADGKAAQSPETGQDKLGGYAKTRETLCRCGRAQRKPTNFQRFVVGLRRARPHPTAFRIASRCRRSYSCAGPDGRDWASGKATAGGFPIATKRRNWAWSYSTIAVMTSWRALVSKSRLLTTSIGNPTPPRVRVSSSRKPASAADKLPLSDLHLSAAGMPKRRRHRPLRPES